MENVATFQEIKTSWTLYDVCLANDIIGYKIELEHKAREAANKKG